MNQEIILTKNQNYQKRIMSYLDGSMDPGDISEFEAQIRTNPDLESQVKSKEEEFMLLKGLIPAAVMSPESLSSLEAEMKTSVFNLIRKEPQSLTDRLKNLWEEWFNR